MLQLQHGSLSVQTQLQYVLGVSPSLGSCRNHLVGTKAICVGDGACAELECLMPWPYVGLKTLSLTVVVSTVAKH
jgi:hypothetical protein